MNKLILELSIAELVLVRQFLIQGLAATTAETFTANAIEDLLKKVINTIDSPSKSKTEGSDK